MKTKPENIPAIVFDWLEAYDFQGLSSEQKQEVLKHSTEEEFNELRQTIVGIKTTAFPAYIENMASRKQTLLARFDSIHSRPLVSIREDTNQGGARFDRIHSDKKRNHRPVFALTNWVWKAAAVFLFFLSSGLIYQKMTVKNVNGVALASSIDTLYVIKEVASAPTWIYDTVFIHLKPKQVKPSYTIDSGYSSNTQTALAGDLQSFNPDPLPVVSLRELDNASNRPKHNSMKDDSLLRRYSFATL